MPAYGARAGRAPLSQQDTGPRLVASIRRTVETGTSLGFSALRCRAIRERLRTGRIALPLTQEVIAEVGYAEISQTEVRATVPLIGYVERFSTRPGERVAVGVSSPVGSVVPGRSRAKYPCRRQFGCADIKLENILQRLPAAIVKYFGSIAPIRGGGYE